MPREEPATVASGSAGRNLSIRPSVLALKACTEGANVSLAQVPMTPPPVEPTTPELMSFEPAQSKSASGAAVELSIVVPAFNEEQRLPKTLQRIHEYLNSRSLRAEVLVVNDGSTDGTARVGECAKADFPELRLISNERNRGKGFSVRRGMLEATGEIALFTDADLSAPIEEADKLLAALREGGYDGAIGSRAINRELIELHQSAFRERAGIIFNYFVRWATGLRFQDTQCGFKAFRLEKSRKIFEQQRIEGFGFDPEILFLARMAGLRIAEIPVRWAHSPATKVRMFRDSVRMFANLLAIRWNAATGRYPVR